MGVLESASRNSVWRGYEYYAAGKVHDLQRQEDGCYFATVQGTVPKPYEVTLDLRHPRKSSCSCPHASGRQIVCKHMVAVYLTAFPDEAQRLLEEAQAEEEEEQAYEDACYERVCRYIGRMKKAELQQTFLELLSDGPEWQYDRFVAQNGLDDD